MLIDTLRGKSKHDDPADRNRARQPHRYAGTDKVHPIVGISPPAA
jgi:hypothetical protein